MEENSAEMSAKLAKLGLAAVLAYGIIDGVTYTSFFVLAFLGYEKTTGNNPAANLQSLLGLGMGSALETPYGRAFGACQNKNAMMLLKGAAKWRERSPPATIRYSTPRRSSRMPSCVENFMIEDVEDDEGGLSDEVNEASPDLKIFVGDLPFSVDSAALAELFERAEEVEMVEVIYDKLTGRSRGFGFVTMSSKEAVEGLKLPVNN